MTKINLTHSPLPDLPDIDTLIWDWNGTLLDDVEVNFKVINKMLSKRGLEPLSLSSYKELFCFPVTSFHRQIGFDFEKESIEDISAEYHAIYRMYESGLKLNADTSFVIDSLREKGTSQYVLSAAMKTDLVKMLCSFDIADKFDGVYGVSDFCATGKVGIGKQLMQDRSLNPQRTLRIGDTLHDAEVAESLGVNYVLYSGGHNSYELLNKKGKVITGLKEILSF